MLELVVLLKNMSFVKCGNECLWYTQFNIVDVQMLWPQWFSNFPIGQCSMNLLNIHKLCMLMRIQEKTSIYFNVKLPFT